MRQLHSSVPGSAARAGLLRLMSQLENLDAIWCLSQAEECAKKSILSRAKEAMCVLVKQDAGADASGMLTDL